MLAQWSYQNQSKKTNIKLLNLHMKINIVVIP